MPRIYSVYTGLTDDESLLELFGGYLAPDDAASDRSMAGVQLDLQPGHPGEAGFGIDHAHLSEDEVLEILFEMPECEEAESNDDPRRSLFFGETRLKKTGVVVCVDERDAKDAGWLRLVTAFYESEEQWRRRTRLGKKPKRRGRRNG